MRFIDNPFQCPVTRTMSIIGGKWKPIVLNCIGDKTIRFGKLNQLIPAISNKVLSKENNKDATKKAKPRMRSTGRLAQGFCGVATALIVPTFQCS